MNEERLGSPAQFAEQLAGHLAASTGAGAPLPSPAELASLVDAMFFASLHEEEGRRVEFSVAWQPGGHGCAAIVAITSPVRATPKNLTKLAPATRSETTSIAVRREGPDLVAWALLERSATAHQPLTIRALGSGILRVEYGGVPCGLYARGQILFLGAAHDVKSPAEQLSRTFPAWRMAADSTDVRALAITRIAARALAHGHGGMILVMPAEVAAPRGVRIHYGVGDGADMLAARYAEAEAIDLVARLTAIDNALLLDTDLRVRGFGVQVIEGDTPNMSFTHVAPYSDDVHVDDLSTFKGTRHPAGVIFCIRQDSEAAAIIASQDGQLSLATKDSNGAVQVLGSYERAFGWR